MQKITEQASIHLFVNLLSGDWKLLYSMEKKVFRSRVSVLYVPILGALLCIGWFASKSSGNFVPLIILGSCTVFTLFAFRSINYVLTDKEIFVYYFGFNTGKFFISAISSVERSYNPFAGAAASAKKLQFQFKRGYKWDRYFSESPFLQTILPLISPVREQEFLETLKSINPNIQINVTDKKGWWRFWDWDI